MGGVKYLDSGQYRVDFNVLKGCTCQVHVKTVGIAIYYGLGEENKCLPFTLTVLPGATLASNCEAHSVQSTILSRQDQVKLETHISKRRMHLRNNRISGRDDVVVKFRSTANSDIQYHGNMLDREDGLYLITYSIPLAGTYLISTTVGGESAKYYVGPLPP